MEHLNRECKQAISGLGANITDASIQRIGKCIGRLCSTLSQYDTVNSVKPESGGHTCHSTDIDLKKIIKQLTEASIFEYQPSRSHRAFPKLRYNMISTPCTTWHNMISTPCTTMALIVSSSDICSEYNSTEFHKINE